MPAEIRHRFVETNGIRMHLAEAGEGPLVLLLHGFPESWYSWRHQLRALAEAGYHAVAPDQRGYGQSDRPAKIEQYTQLHLVGDVIGLLDALGEEQAVVVGHDWGAPVAWNTAVMRPDRVRGVAGLSVAYGGRGRVKPTEALKRAYEGRFFYQLYFQEPGVAEAELEADPRDTILRLLAGLRADGSGLTGTQTRFLEPMRAPDTLPDWLTEADLNFYAGEFRRNGFRGGLSWYRAMDLTWELTAPFAGAKVTVPAIYIAGERDPVLGFSGAAVERLRENAPGLRDVVMLPGCGHWTQQERPAEVNAALLNFIAGL